MLREKIDEWLGRTEATPKKRPSKGGDGVPPPQEVEKLWGGEQAKEAVIGEWILVLNTPQIFRLYYIILNFQGVGDYTTQFFLGIAIWVFSRIGVPPNQSF